MLFIILIFKNCLSQGNNRLDSNRFVWRFGDYIFITSMTPSRAFVLVIREYIGWIHVKFMLVRPTPVVTILALFPISVFRIFHPILMEVHWGQYCLSWVPILALPPSFSWKCFSLVGWALSMPTLDSHQTHLETNPWRFGHIQFTNLRNIWCWLKLHIF